MQAGPVIPVFILDPLIEETHGAAPKWRLEQSLADLDAHLRAQGSRLILRRGSSDQVLRDLISQTGARHVIWSRLYDPRSIQRDSQIKADLTASGVQVQSVNASLLFEPWQVQTKTGGFYRVYSPFWRGVRDIGVRGLLPTPGDLAPPDTWPETDVLADWRLGHAMNRGGAVLARHAVVGQDAARDRLGAFIDSRIAHYKAQRDQFGQGATSGLSENLAWGEISPHTLWWAGQSVLDRYGAQAEHFLKEVVWREFAYHLLYHTPHIETRNWRPEWDSFPWRDDNSDARLWRRGMTGIELVDAAMREMYVTGTMHNRGRMLVASFLTKHLMTDWRVGEAWFRECLIDWDPASNAMGWQWTAGSGPDAAPYFRIFNPDGQAEKFDQDRRYRDRFLAQGQARMHPDALSFFDAVPRSWGLSPDQPYPAPMIGLADGRQRALAAYEAREKT